MRGTSRTPRARCRPPPRRSPAAPGRTGPPASGCPAPGRGSGRRAAPPPGRGALRDPPAFVRSRSAGSPRAPPGRAGRGTGGQAASPERNRRRTPRTPPCGPDRPGAGQASRTRERSASLPAGRALLRGARHPSVRCAQGTSGGVGARARRRDPRAPVPADGIGGVRLPMAPTGRRFVIANHGQVPSALPETLKPLAQRFALARKAVRTVYAELGSLRHLNSISTSASSVARSSVSTTSSSPLPSGSMPHRCRCRCVAT